jgi:hypothetical protein
MIKLYDEFFDICSSFDRFVQEERWSKITNFIEFKNYIDNEFNFWKRVICLLPPEKRLVKEFGWFKQCYLQINKRLKNEKINKKMKWIQTEEKQDIKLLFKK